MKAKELRIGNKVFDALGSVVNIDLILICNVEFMKLKPIPLTEEWLLKFGFVKTNSIWDFEGIEISSWLTFKFSNNPIKSKDIDSVHQLQNLYFALTNQELNIK